MLWLEQGKPEEMCVDFSDKYKYTWETAILQFAREQPAAESGIPNAPTLTNALLAHHSTFWSQMAEEACSRTSMAAVATAGVPFGDTWKRPFQGLVISPFQTLLP